MRGFRAPFLVLSVPAHAALFRWLSGTGIGVPGAAPGAGGGGARRVLVNASLRRTQAAELQKHVRRLEVKLPNGPEYVFFSVVLTPR